MTWCIITAVIAFICGGSAVAYGAMAVLQLDALELGRVDRIRKVILRECHGCARYDRILEIIDKESEL